MLYKLSFTIGLSYIAFLLPISISALKPTSIPPFFKIEGIVAFAQETTDAHFVEAERLNQQGIQQFNSGQVYQALEIFQQELELRRQLGDRAGEGGVLNNIGSVYDALGQYQEALSFYEEALIIRQTIGDQRGEGESFNNIGSIYDNLGRYQEAVTYYERSLAISQEIGDRNNEGQAFSNIGYIYNALGRYQEALDYYGQSLTILQEIGNLQGESITLNNIGSTLSRLGQYYEALDYYERSLAIRREIGNRRGEGTAIDNIGSIYAYLGQYYEALDYYEQSLAIRQEIGDRRGEGVTLGNIGFIYGNLEQDQEALDYYEQSLAIHRELGNRHSESVILSNIGTIYNNSGQYQRALNYYEQSIFIIQEIGDRTSEGIVLSNLGEALFDSGDLYQAENRLFDAVEVLESLRLGGLPEAQRISLVETQLETFQALQRVLIAQNKVDVALEVAERGRARIFYEELASRLSPESILQLEETLLPNIAQIQQIAKDQNVTLVQYSIIQNEEPYQLYIWVIQPTGAIAFQQVNLQDQNIDLSAIVGTTRSSIGVFRSIVAWGENEDAEIPDSFQTDQRLQQLHQILIDPIAELLPDDPNQTVIFIPQDELFLVPFAALQANDGTHLIDRHTILTSPSIQILESTQIQQERVQQVNHQANLVIGDPTMPHLSVVPGEDPIVLDPLPGAEQEAIDIANRLGTEPLLGDDATKSTVVQQMPNARIIHLATHGILDEFQGLNSGVVLAADGTGEFNDGLLTAAEIAQMNLNAELVVLSACNTGQGRITGDGVVGLSRSLILSGVPSVVVSLWAVPDAPTGELMVEFYRQLEQTDNKAQALRQAMLTIREDYPEPIAWAAFTLIGEAE